MKFYDSSTTPETGLSYVIIKHKKNKYTGQAKCHPEDKFSELTGCRYAEARAEIKALKDEWRQKKAACEECRKFVNAVMQYSRFDKNEQSSKAMFRQLNCRIREVNKLAEEIGRKEFNLQVKIRQQDKINQKRLNKNT